MFGPVSPPVVCVYGLSRMCEGAADDAATDDAAADDDAAAGRTGGCVCSWSTALPCARAWVSCVGVLWFCADRVPVCLLVAAARSQQSNQLAMVALAKSNAGPTVVNNNNNNNNNNGGGTAAWWQILGSVARRVCVSSTWSLRLCRLPFAARAVPSRETRFRTRLCGVWCRLCARCGARAVTVVTRPGAGLVFVFVCAVSEPPAHGEAETSPRSRCVLHPSVLLTVLLVP